MADDKKELILLVDDNKHMLVTLSDYLAFEGFEVEQAHSGEEALKKLEKIKPDLIILDISMPGMGGVGFLKRVSSSEGKPRYPILVLTARSAMEEFFDTMDVDGFLAKPCAEADLVRTVRGILDQRWAARKQARMVEANRILLAEDDRLVAARLRKALLEADLAVDVVQNGPETLERAATRRPDLILIKEVLPRMNGSIVASVLKGMPSLSSVPVVLYDETQSERAAFLNARTPENVDRFVPSADGTRLIKAISDLLPGYAGRARR